MMEIKERIRKAMEVRGMTASELAKKSGIAKGSISKYLNGLVVPKQSAIGEMAKALSVSPAWLMGYDVEMESKKEDTIKKLTTMIFDGDISRLNEPNQARLLAYYQALLDTQNADAEDIKKKLGDL